MRSVSPGLVALALAAMAVAAPVYAADMSVAPAYNPPTPVPPAAYNWTAFYVGGNIGAGLLHDSATQAAAGVLALPGSFNVNPVGLVGGAQAGFDYQFSSVVVGAQASLSDSYITGQTTETAVGGLSQLRLTSEPTWFASVTGRARLCRQHAAVLRQGRRRLDAYRACRGQSWRRAASAAGPSQSISDTRSGFVGGVGLEYAMTENLSALFEYDFYDFGTKTEPFFTTPIAIRSDLHTLTVGLNYRFNWASGGQPYCPTC